MSQNKMQNQETIMRKIGVCDMMLESLGKIHVDEKEKVDEMTKKISIKKLILMDELYASISSLTVS